MNRELILAIDAGTGSCRAVLFSLDGTQVAFEQREYNHPAVPDAPGSQIFDTEANWGLICECIQGVISSIGESPDSIKAVSSTSMREGMVLYDARGREIWACPNVDSRAAREAADLVRSGDAAEIYALAGDWVSITAPARFRWIAEHEPQIFASIAHVGMLGDWIVTKLSGEFVTDPSLGSSSGMFELSNRDWSNQVLEICGLDRDVFPPVVDSGTLIGGVTADAATDTGLRKGTPVVVGGADTQLALLGIGVSGPGRFTVVGGSFWQQTLVLDRPLVDRQTRLRTLCHSEPGQWMIEGIGFYCGIVMRWFRDAFCDSELAEAARERVDVYRLLERKAEALPPGSNGVVGLFSNLMQADHWVHSAPGFLGFDVADPSRSGRVECFRAIEESAAYVSKGHLRIVEEVSGAKLDSVVLTGGAANGQLWPQILADVLELPIRIPVVKESTALGASIYAGVGAGFYDDAAATANDLVRFERTVDPRPDAAAAYAQLFEQWLELYPRVLALSEAGLVRPLWRAAGT